MSPTGGWWDTLPSCFHGVTFMYACSQCGRPAPTSAWPQALIDSLNALIAAQAAEIDRLRAYISQLESSILTSAIPGGRATPGTVGSEE